MTKGAKSQMQTMEMPKANERRITKADKWALFFVDITY